jgi:hypothetical protein
MADIVRVGGVPEHFNYCWQLGMSQGTFAKHNVGVAWSEQKNGTGAMVQIRPCR